MAVHVLADTNVLIGLLNGQIHPHQLKRFARFSVSTLTVMELVALSGMSRTEEIRVLNLVRALNVIPLDTAIAVRAGRLARTRTRDRIDLLIAATALEHQIPVLTKNVRDFRRIPGLEVLADLTA
jgi:predicted nucleic acid-binding protein